MKAKLFSIFFVLLFCLDSNGQNTSKLDTIVDTNLDPYKFVCYQHIHRKRTLKDSYFQSTGFLIARNVVLTAAHNLYSVSGSKVDEITIWPGRYKDYAAYDSITITGLKSCAEAIRVNPKFKWGKVSYDFAIIIIPENLIASVKNWPSQSSFELDIDNILVEGEKINVAGFPASGGYNGSLMIYQSQNINFVDQTTIPHNLNTETGNSGSPVWIERNGRKIIVGIHTYAGLATKLTPDAINMIRDWTLGEN